MIKRVKNNQFYHIEFTKGDLSEKAMTYYFGQDMEITQARTGLHKGEFYWDGELLAGDIEGVDDAFCALYDDLPWWDIEDED